MAMPGDPYFGWVSKIGGWEKRRQMFGMFLFVAYYFSHFVFAMSLFAQAFGSRSRVFSLLGVEFCAICAYMGWKGKLFGNALLAKPSTFTNYILPFICWAVWCMLVSAAPMLIASFPLELGPEMFAGTMIWRLLTNGGIIYVAFGVLREEHYLSLTTGMAGYGVSLGLATAGLAIFFRNCEPTFDWRLFWRPKSGRQHVRDILRSKKIWAKAHKTKDDESWDWIGFIYPTYLPFDFMTPWMCEDLVEKYEEEGVTRPDWMNNEKKDEFIKRIVTIYEWKGAYEEEIGEALVKLFGKSCVDLEKGVEGQLTFIKSKKSKKKLEQIEPEENT
ncbi:hypothetical protein TL16_g02721 [Triparma laevis f. inornata]|uniref:Uncharacterized protein n=1 Tax=Triparma laevis f. inornata TaxID=1714386 RepID=A0A9W6ZQH5_9STRA|nr:hypothetical protein TL16_g02721 [Triparma laevis f. inornata]